jgi:hypothetical protein
MIRESGSYASVKLQNCLLLQHEYRDRNNTFFGKFVAESSNLRSTLKIRQIYKTRNDEMETFLAFLSEIRCRVENIVKCTGEEFACWYIEHRIRSWQMLLILNKEARPGLVIVEVILRSK